jgi:hypothetical protein
MAPLEPRKTRLLPRLHPPEERLIGRVQAGQHVLQHLGREGSVVGEGGADVLEFGFLLIARARAALAATPPGDALLQGGVVKSATAQQHPLTLPLWLGRWLELVLERFADGAARRAGDVLLPRASFCLIGCRAARGRTSGSSLAQAGSASPRPLQRRGLRRAKAHSLVTEEAEQQRALPRHLLLEAPYLRDVQAYAAAQTTARQGC